MVQFFNLGQSTKGRAAEEAGKAFGSGIGDVLQEVSQYKRQRGRLQEALKSLDNLTPEDRRNPNKLLTSLISATAGIPGAEKFVGPVFDTMTRYAQSKAAAGMGGEAPEQMMQPQERQALPSFQTPGRQPQPAQARQPSPITPEAVTEQGLGQGQLQVPAQPSLGSAGFINAPTHDFLRRQEVAAGGTGELTDQRVSKINQTVREGRKLAKEDRDWIMENQQLEKARENEFKQFADPLVQQEFGTLAPLEQVRFYQYAKDIDRKSTENGELLRPNDLYEKSRLRLNDYLTYKGNLEGSPLENGGFKGGIQERPTFFGHDSSKYKEDMRKLHNDVMPLVTMGETDEVRRILSGKGYFSDEIEEAINPLPESEKNAFVKTAGRASEPKTTFGKLKPETYQEQRNKDVDKLYKGLQESLNQGSSLVLLMREAERMGYDYKEFDDAYQRMIENGYEPSAQQVRDRPLLNKPTMNFLRKIFG